MTNPLDRAARAALWEAYKHHGTAPWAPTRRNPRAAQYERGLLNGWLWEPRPGALAITEAGVAELRPYMLAERLPDRPAEKREGMR